MTHQSSGLLRPPFPLCSGLVVKILALFCGGLAVLPSPARAANTVAASLQSDGSSFQSGRRQAGGGIFYDAAMPAPAITSAPTANAKQGQAFTYQITASNAPTGYAASGLPAGLSVNAAGLISGTPTAAGAFTVGLSATNPSGTGTATLTLTVQSAGTPAAHAPVIAGQPGGQIVAGEAFAYQIVTDGTVPVDTYSAAGLPTGLTLDAATGLISGELPVGTALGPFDVALGAGNGAGTGVQVRRTFTVLAAPVGKAADVTSAFSADRKLTLLANGKYKFKGTYTLANVGTKTAKNVAVAAYLSSSPTFSFPAAGDSAGAGLLPIPVYLATTDAAGNPLMLPTIKVSPAATGAAAVVTVPKLTKAGKDGSTLPVPFILKVPAVLLRAGGPYRYLLVVADPQGNLVETGKANNVAAFSLPAAGP